MVALTSCRFCVQEPTSSYDRYLECHSGAQSASSRIAEANAGTMQVCYIYGQPLLLCALQLVQQVSSTCVQAVFQAMGLVEYYCISSKIRTAHPRMASQGDAI